ncbi:serine hydrolase domain-containing protein [Variovorax sp. M-6]|uniref:serine hydrolase domain-containing protein n=1 Tax=Variovorax sp. M-6 TaxID=3233041 RepID=UPI003F973BDD
MYDSAAVRWCRDAIQATLNRSDNTTTAVSVALLADDRVVWREAFGYANRETGLLATPDMRFNVASIGKLFATLAVMILRDRGKLSLDQPLVELLPTFSMRSPAFKQITVRHMVSHSSGVPGANYRNLFNFAPILDYAQDTLKALAQSHLKHEPGELAVYCNDGFTLVEPLVLQLTGLSFPAFAQREIFDPLGMSLSAYPVDYAAEGSFIHPYHKGQRMPQEMGAPFATGGILTTPTDLLKLARLFLDEGMFDGRRIVSADAVREMGSAQIRRIDPASTKTLGGLGWDSVRQPGMNAAGLKAWNKSGGTDFFSSDFFVLPEARLAMMITGCGYDYGPVQLAEGLLQRVAAERQVIRSLPPAIVAVVPPPVSPAPDNSAVAGIYANYNHPYHVRAESDGSLTLRTWDPQANRWGDAPRAQLRARSDGCWWADGKPDLCIRFQEVSGHRYLMLRALSVNKLYWEEVADGEWLPPQATPLPPAWQARIGSQWRCVNDSPDSVKSRLWPLVWRIETLPELPGYLFLSTVQPPDFSFVECAQLLRVVNDQEAGMTIKIPYNAGRDLFELSMVQGKDQEELHSGSLVFHRAG